MADDPTPRLSDLSRSYGTNWTRTNVSTLFEWVNIAAFNIRCLELCIIQYRRIIRNQMILNLILSATSGTMSVSQFGFSGSQNVDFAIKILFTIFSFLITLSAGALKIYQVQERLEAAIRIKQEWIVFSTAIASELQLPIELRRDGLWMIKKNKDTYLDLMKTEVEVPEAIKKAVAKELPHPADLHLDVISLSRIMIDICNSELTDMQSANARNRDRFSRTAGATRAYPNTPVALPDNNTENINIAVPERVVLNVTPPRVPVAVQISSEPTRPPPTPPISPERDD
jgi:hypothetical protein